MNHYEDILPTGRHWSFVLRRGVNLKLTDVSGAGNVGMLMYNPFNPLERLNLPDTLKCQHTFTLTTGHCLYSDMGRIFCSVIEDDLGWHDASSGTCNASLVKHKWGVGTYQDLRNSYLCNGRDSFLIELAKYGLGKRDMTANMNWFSRVDVNESGDMTLNTANTVAGASVVLRFEMDTLVILHTCPHPLDDATDYPNADIRFELSLAPPVAEDDTCRLSREENGRGFMNNALYHLGV